jgi:hypothetical protein
MEPFKVTCVTCTARLAVRSESLLGQIVACPKCGSMVHVVPPAGADTPHASGMASDIAPAAAVVALESVAPAMAPPIAPPAPQHAAATFDDVADATSGDPVPAHAAAPPTVPPPFVPKPAVAAGSGSKLAVLTAVSAVAGSALVAGLIMLLRFSPDAAPSSVQPPPVAAQSTSEFERDAATPPVTVEEPSHSPEETAAAPVVPDATSAPADDNPFAPPVEESEPRDETAAIATAPPVEPAADPAAAPTEAATEDAKAPKLHIDPLEFDPEGLDLTTLMTGRPLADPLAASQFDEGPAPAADSAVPPDDGDDGQPEAAPEPLRFEPTGPPSNVAELLKRRIPSTSIEGMPLCRFVDFATELAGLPVSISPDELRLAAVSAGAKVSVEAKDATIEQVLTEALKPLRLAPAVEGARIELRRAGVDKRRELNYPVDDLVANDAEVKRLAAWMQDLVAPATWKSHGGDGVLYIDGTTLHIEHDQRVGFETILFLERYRVAGGLPPRSRYPAALLSVGPAGAALDERLAGPTTFTFTRPTALRAVFRYWQEELHTAVLIDWPALTSQRLWPQSRMTASAINQPWSAALTASLTPLQLGWRAIDGRTIEITTLDKIRSEPQLALYRIAAGATAKPDQVLKQVARLAEAGGAAGADAAVFYDAEHRVLMVRQPAPVQAHVTAWLREEGLLEVAAAK